MFGSIRSRLLLPLLLLACGAQDTLAIAESPDAASEALTLDEAQSTSITPLLWLVGDWTCTGQYLDLPPLVQAHPVTVSFPIRKAVAKTWLTGKYTEAQTNQNPLPITRVEHIAVDHAAGHGVRVAIDNNIGRIDTSFDGYYGDVVTYTGTYTIAGITLPFGQTVTRINNHKFTSEATLNVGAGPQVFGQLTCTK